MNVEGRGESGVALVGEALGEQEAEKGLPFQGPAGHVLNNALTRAGINRGSLSILNIIWCQPPNNELLGKDYYPPAAAQCMDRHTIPALKAIKPKVIVALGGIPFYNLVSGTHILDARGYPVWSDKYNAWVMPTVHPSYIQRGNYNYEAILIHDLQRAMEIAERGFKFKNGKYLLDPTPEEAMAWAKSALLSPHPMSVDIETPYKGSKEDTVELGEIGDPSYTILRLSFASRPYEGMSIPWRSEYMQVIRFLLESEKEKVWWNGIAYDIPRIRWNGVEPGGVQHDGMVAWHVLNSDLPKDLGTVATFLTPDQQRWKHLSEERPAYYNAVDADVALRCTLAAFEELKKAGLWKVYERHVLRFDKITSRMSKVGMPISRERQKEYAKKVADDRAALDKRLEEVVPLEIRPKFVYKNPPREREGLIKVGEQSIPTCSRCGFERPPKTHFAKATKKFPDRQCHGATITNVEVGQWARLEPLKVSYVLSLKYMEYMKHPKVFHGKGEDRKPTTNENALRQLLLKFPDDPYYPLVLKISKLRTLAGRYIGYPTEDGGIRGGLLIGRDDRVHTVFSHNPSTLRQASENPNMQNIPRGADDYSKLVKNMFVAGEGRVFIARDYSGIESILVGYFAGARQYTRISMIDIHTFTSLWTLYELEKKIKFEDVPQMDWSDADLRGHLREWKPKIKTTRQGVKHMGHAGNYGAKAKKVQEVLFDELGVMVPTKDIKKFLDFYYQLFPEIPAWHRNLARQVDGAHAEHDLMGLSTGAGYVRNPYGYLHRFYEVIRWKKIHGKWEWELGDSAKALIAFGPQSTAAGIMKEAAIRFDENHPELAQGLRLFVHDEILGEWMRRYTDEVLAKLKLEMEKPNPELPLDPAWDMGTHLAIPSEGKVGDVWGEMREVKD